MADTGYDTLRIKVVADTDEAKSGIKSFSSSLTKLNDKVKDLDLERLQEVQKLLLDISNIDFTNVVKGLESVVAAFNSLNSKAIKAGKKSDGSGADLGGTREGRAGGTDVSRVLDYSSLGLTSAGSTDIVGEAIETYRSELARLSDVASSITYPITELGSAIRSEGTAATETSEATEDLSKKTKKLGKASNEAQNNLKKILKQFARITRYRIIRKLIQEIYKALQQGIQGVAMFDDNFNTSMSNIVSSFKFLSNSIGSLLAPLISLFEPALSALVQGLGEATNAFAEFFAAMNGQDTFTKATMTLEDYRESLKKTSSIGIDELNVLNPENQGFTNEQVTISDKIKDNFSGVKELLSEIMGMVGQFFSVLKDLMDKVLPAISNLLKPIVKIVGNIIKLITILIDQTFDEVNTSITDFVNMIAKIFTFISDIVVALMPELVAIMNILAPIINMINTALGAVFDIVGQIFVILSPIIRFVGALLTPLSVILTVVSTIFYVMEGIIDTMKKILTFDFTHIDDVWADVGNKIGKAWTEMAKASGNTFSNLTGETYATGGFPEDGIFFANHNELIGGFDNGRTVVANNEQIIEGIKQGVLEAMIASGNGNVNVYVDSQEISRIVERDMNNRGTNSIYGGAIRYGK